MPRRSLGIPLRSNVDAKGKGSGLASGDFTMLPCATPGTQAVVANSRLQFARHSHDQFGIGVIECGAQSSHSGRGQVEAGPGDAITVNPGEVHDGAPIGESGRSWHILYFDPDLIGAAAADIFSISPAEFELSRPVIGDIRVTSLLDRLFAAEATPSSERIVREELLLRLVAAIGGHAPPPASAAPEIARARQKIDDDPSDAISLAELAEIAGLSRFQLLRAFRQASGLTPHAYLVQRRIDLARRLIRTGAVLADAAAAAGFADQSHMTRIFIRKFGLSPGAYARAVG